MAAAPRLFFKLLGHFDAYNDHYIHDLATFYLALSIATLASLRRQSWRVPVLVITTIQYGLHSLSHLDDIAKAHPRFEGPVEFAVFAASTMVLIWVTRRAIAEAGYAGVLAGTTSAEPMANQRRERGRAGQPVQR